MQRQAASWVILRDGKGVLETFVFPFGLKPGFAVVPILPYLYALNAAIKLGVNHEAMDG